MSVKNEIIKLLIDYEKGKYSNIALNSFFTNFKFKKEEKAFITEVYYGVIRNQVFIDYLINKRVKKIKKEYIKQLLRASVYQGIFMESDEAGAVWEAVELSKKYGEDISRFVNGTLRNIFRGKDEEIKQLKENKNFTILYSYPEKMVLKFKEKYGENYEKALISYKKIPSLGMRINSLKYTETEFEEYLNSENINILKKIGQVYYFKSSSILESKIFKSGKIIVQDASSYSAAILLDVKEGEKVLDACAAPGTKSILMAETSNNKADITSLDIHKHKIKLMKKNFSNAGVKGINSILGDATEIYFEEKFDKILLDVPCSAYGVIRKKPETIYKNKDLKEISYLQRKILENISKYLKVNGSLVYSTCTIFDEENILNIKRFLEKNPNFVVELDRNNIPENLTYSIDDLGGIVIDYREEFADGFYMIKLKKVR